MTPPTALISWAHSSNAAEVADDDPIRAAADAQWKQTVLDFLTGLRVQGRVDADLDLAHVSEPVDWTRWGPSKVRESDYVLVAVNRAWRRRFDGDENPTVGAGTAAEADELLGLYSRDRGEFRRKVIPIVLAGASDDDVPARLQGLPRFVVQRFDETGLEELLRRIYGAPKHPLPPLREQVPPLPPSPTSSDAAAAGGTASEQDLRDRLDVVDSGLRALPPDAANDPQSLPWSRQWHLLQQERARIRAELERRGARQPKRPTLIADVSTAGAEVRAPTGSAPPPVVDVAGQGRLPDWTRQVLIGAAATLLAAAIIAVITWVVGHHSSTPHGADSGTPPTSASTSAHGDENFRFDDRAGGTGVIHVYAGPSTSSADRTPTGTFEGGQTATAICKVIGRPVSSNPAAGEQPRTSNVWVQLTPADRRYFAVLTYGDISPAALAALPQCG